jgi:hypothetical protein
MSTNTQLRLRHLFRTLAASSLAAGGAGCGDRVDAPFNRASFDQNVCVDGAYRWVHGLAPAEPVDYAALRSITDWGTGALEEPILMHPTGAPCTEAGDLDACLEDLAALPTGEGFSSGGVGFEPPTRLQVAYTRGDEVDAVTNLDDLRAFLGEVDTAEEAALVSVLEHGFRVDCGSDNARFLPEGIHVILRSGMTCGEGVKEHLVFVRPDGTTEILETRVIERGDPSCVIGRLTSGVRPRDAGAAHTLAQHLARMASLEASAVFAFRRIAGEMRALGAPHALIVRALAAADDEIRHAAMVGAEARRRGEAPLPVEAGPMPRRPVLEIALENVREGMVRETYGALAATYQARAARDPRLARMLAVIAEDETRHAALSIDFGAFLDGLLDDAEREKVARAREEAARRLPDDVAVSLAPEVHEALGWPAPAVARELAEKAFPAAWG